MEFRIQTSAFTVINDVDNQQFQVKMSLCAAFLLSVWKVRQLSILAGVSMELNYGVVGSSCKCFLLFFFLLEGACMCGLGGLS